MRFVGRILFGGAYLREVYSRSLYAFRERGLLSVAVSMSLRHRWRRRRRHHREFFFWELAVRLVVTVLLTLTINFRADIFAWEGVWSRDSRDDESLFSREILWNLSRARAHYGVL